MTIMKIMIIVVVMALKGSGLLADHEEVVKLFDVKDYYFFMETGSHRRVKYRMQFIRLS